MSRNGAGLVLLSLFGFLPVVPACGEGSKTSEASSGGSGGTGTGGMTTGASGGRDPGPPRCEVVDCVNGTDCCKNANFACTGVCAEGACSFACASDDQCPSEQHCSLGTCVACLSATDCSSSGQFDCVGGACVNICHSASGCQLGQGCFESHCADRCDEDRDCSLVSGLADASCGADGSCVLPCSTDQDCHSVDPWLHSATCTSGRCVVTGCASDDQCYQALLVSNPMDPALHDNGAYIKCVKPE